MQEYILDDETFSFPRVLDQEIYVHASFLMLLQSQSIAYLTLWTYIWQIRPRSWTFYAFSLTPSDDMSAMEYCKFGQTPKKGHNCWHKSSQTWTFHSLLLTPSDVTLPIKKSILGILNIFLAKEYSILNFLHILTDTFWCHISFTGVLIWPNEHISGRKVLDSKLSMHTHWFALILCAPYVKPFWPTEKYLWQISPWWWNFYTKALTLGATSNRQ